MNVRLENYTKSPEITIASIAKTSYSQSSFGENLSKFTNDLKDAQRLVEELYTSGHMSPFEHVSFSFSISKVSRTMTHQLVRHRIASYMQQSQRYVDMEKNIFVIPKTVVNSELFSESIKLVDANSAFYKKLVEAGIPKEDARYYLPEGMGTNIILTMNYRSLHHFCSERLCTKSQWEIRRLAEKIKQQVTNVSPLLGKFLDSKCIHLGLCNEKNGCGKMPTRLK